MINFDEEIKNYEPSLEIEEAESAIYSHDLTDVTDIIAQLLREQDKRQVELRSFVINADKMQAGTINALYVGLIFHFLKELLEYPTHTTMMVYKRHR